MTNTIDADTIAEPKPERRSGPQRADRSPQPTTRQGLPRVRGKLLLLAVLGLCAFIAAREIGQRLENRSRLGLASVTLHAVPTNLAVSSPATVLSTNVRAQQQVEAGQALLVIETEEKVAGWPQRRAVSLVAPHAGVVLGTPPAQGSAVDQSQPVLQLYDPEQLVFRAPVSFGLLSQARIGMVAVLEFPSVGKIETTFTSVEPRLGINSRTAPDEERAYLILTPVDPADVRNLVPGLTMSGYLDTESVADTAPTGVKSGGLAP